ncbi:patatin-like phospholipase family protein [Candidatus Wolfebacteria bacterium]|nr:patatin-like phospholipase family protein [Candidatus Wolfebacteria bacterium]
MREGNGEIKTIKRPYHKIGLALGSGGAKGLAHIGIIKILEANKIPIDFIAGSSIGAVIGGLYAATKNIKKVEEIFLSNNRRQLLKLIIDPSIKGGFISGDKFEIFLRNIIEGVKFGDLKIPFTAVSTNLKTGKSVLINKGDVSLAIRSSMSVPLFFKPSKIGNCLLVDGGLSHPVPVEAVKNMGADFVIAVNLDAHCFYHNHGDRLGLSDVAHYTMSILRHHLSELSAQGADIVVEPDIHNPSLIGWRDFLDGKKIIKKGEIAAKVLMPKLKKSLKEML